MPRREDWRVERARDSLRRAALKYAEADSDEDYKRADDNLRKVAHLYVDRKRKYERRQGA